MTDNEQAARKARQERAIEQMLAQRDAEAAAVRPVAPPRPSVRAGWYPHPSMVGTQRYWDGQRWTDHIAPAAPARTPASKPKDPTALLTVGALMMLLFPVGGFIAGAILLNKTPVRGALMMFGSVLVAAWGFHYFTTV